MEPAEQQDLCWQVRKTTKMSTSELAELIGVSRCSISRWQNNQQPMPGPVRMLFSLILKRPTQLVPSMCRFRDEWLAKEGRTSITVLPERGQYAPYKPRVPLSYKAKLERHDPETWRHEDWQGAGSPP